MIWPSSTFDIILQNFKKPLDIFSLPIERKRSKEYLVLILAVKESFERFSLLEFIFEKKQTPGHLVVCHEIWNNQTQLFLWKKVSRATSPVWLSGGYDGISSAQYISLLHRGNKTVYQLKSKVTNNLFIKTQMMCYKRAWQNQIGLLCYITETNI